MNYEMMRLYFFSIRSSLLNNKLLHLLHERSSDNYNKK